MRCFGRALAVAGLALAAGGALAQEATGALAPEATGALAPGTVGDAVCLGCHASVSDGYAHTAHARVLGTDGARSALMRRGCESCHGAGGAHARSAGKERGEGWLSFAETGAGAERAKSEACLQCHQGDTQRYWHGSAHESRGLSCGSCHAVMKPISTRHLLSQPSETELCAGCHPLAVSQGRRQSHMPTRTGAKGAGGEGAMSCASCHNPHGTVADKLIAAHTINDNCTSCHAEKRGPFLWEHAPVSESCLNCHVAHGSLKPNLLRVSAPRLCQSCHVAALHPSEARQPGSRFVLGQSCMHCHSQVHGSNHPSGTFLTR